MGRILSSSPESSKSSASDIPTDLSVISDMSSTAGTSGSPAAQHLLGLLGLQHCRQIEPWVSASALLHLQWRFPVVQRPFCISRVASGLRAPSGGVPQWRGPHVSRCAVRGPFGAWRLDASSCHRSCHCHCHSFLHLQWRAGSSAA